MNISQRKRELHLYLVYNKSLLWTAVSPHQRNTAGRVRCSQSGSALGAQSPCEGKARQIQKLGRGHEEDMGENESPNLSESSCKSFPKYTCCSLMRLQTYLPHGQLSQPYLSI